MKVAVAGGTGVVGSYAVETATADGHEVVVLSRRQGVDVAAGTGLAAALQGVNVIIDTLNTPSQARDKASAFFIAAATQLQQTGAAAGVTRIVTLSIVGIDKVPTGYYQAKLAQEKATMAGAVPATIVRATQFYEFRHKSCLERSAARLRSCSAARRSRSRPVPWVGNWWMSRRPTPIRLWSRWLAPTSSTFLSWLGASSGRRAARHG